MFSLQAMSVQFLFLRKTNKMKIRPATVRDVDILFDIRTCVRENHESQAALASLGITPQSVAEMLRGEDSAWMLN